MTRSVREGIMALVEDPWQARLNRRGRRAPLPRRTRRRGLLPLPMLALSAAITFAVPVSAFHWWARFELGLPLTTAAAVLWGVASIRLGGDTSTRWRLPVFAAHTALAAALVWVDPAFGVFAYIGFLYSYGLGPRWRIAGFIATALGVSAAMAGGLPARPARPDPRLPADRRGAGGAGVQHGPDHHPGPGPERRAGPDDRRAGRGQPAAGRLDGGEQPPARPAGRPGPGGGHGRGAAA